VVDANCMKWFSNASEKPMSLTYEERKEFDRLDQAVALAARAAKVVIEGGRALKVIRDKQLFRDTAPNWEGYLSRHGLSRRRADQLVSAAGVLDAVSEAVSAELGTAVPDLSERAIRPLVGMDSDEAAKVVIEAAKSPEGITAGSIRKAAGRRRKAKVPKARRFRVPGAVIEVTFNAKGNGSAIDALTAALRQAEAELEAQSAEAA
jgi:hypothetical protein